MRRRAVYAVAALTIVPWVLVAYVLVDKVTNRAPRLAVPHAADLVLPSHMTPEERRLALLTLRDHYARNHAAILRVPLLPSDPASPAARALRTVGVVSPSPADLEDH